ncbi:S8 family serine peptidase [Pseudoxanthomonas sp. CAU 1598]|uniref:S8 family serine peptidase n=2 Tax=Pseudomarimonas arenosa TaxID=2774145 RepID=A0AAW3ZLX3_9GAMM|nr:S8 family serine peptidase [Pseudomarimonas arenosa]
MAPSGHRCSPLIVGSTRLALAVGLSLSLWGVANAAVEVGPDILVDSLRSGETYEGIIVKFRDQSSKAKRGDEGRAARSERIARLAKSSGLPLIEARQLAVGAVLIQHPAKSLNAEQALQLLEALANDPEIEYAEPNTRMYAQFTPNDPDYMKQWHYHNSLAGLRLPKAWDWSTGNGVTVAVLDSGITDHPDLNGNLVPGYDFISDSAAARDGDGRDDNPQDEGDWFAVGDCPAPIDKDWRNSSWHGTHVAGTVAARTHNASGVAGVAFNANIQPVRVLGRCGGTTADIVDAIVWAAGGEVDGVPKNPTPARVINMSLGGMGSCGSATRDAINFAVLQAGAAVVVAAGNDNVSVTQATPANCKNVLNVAALAPNGDRAYYSNHGPWVDVAAPGGSGKLPLSDNIYSTWNAGTTVPGMPSYKWSTGTSMAAPHVAGLAAMVFSASPGISGPEVETIIKSTARPIPGNCPEKCGKGLADASAALNPLFKKPSLANGKGKWIAGNLSEKHLLIVVPDLSKKLRVEVRGSHVDLYLQEGSEPSTRRYQCRTYAARGVNYCEIDAPAEGLYHLMAVPQRGFTGATLLSTYERDLD